MMWVRTMALMIAVPQTSPCAATPRRVEVVIIGAGPCGALMAQRLATAGVSVLVLEAGPRLDAARDLTNSEANAGRILWQEPRQFVGADFVTPKVGTGVGGGSLAWMGVMPRFSRSDFRTRSSEGVGEDWPIGYDDLRPYYAQIEHEIGVAGDCGPCVEEPYTLPMPAHPLNWHAQVLARGARALGARPFAPPIAINSQPRGGRPACVYCGYCGSGCPTNAKASGANTWLPQAEAAGARVIAGAFVERLRLNLAGDRLTGVDYLDQELRTHRVDADLVVLAANPMENTRLLLLSANAQAPDGVANSSGLVGRFFMSHPTWQVFGTFDEPINAFKGMQMGHVMVQDHHRPDPAADHARGYILLSYMMTPVTFGNLSGLSFGQEFKDTLYDYAHTAAWWAHAEGLPFADNAITLDTQLRDTRGLPVTRVTYAWGDNDVRVAAAARDRAAAMMAASGARTVRIGLNYGAHAMGGLRMGQDRTTSVVDSYGRSHDVRNLVIADSSVFVTGSGVNPTLTSLAITARAADHLIATRTKGSP
jgi:choline dehydrogenase-like flavoprotein